MRLTFQPNWNEVNCWFWNFTTSFETSRYWMMKIKFESSEAKPTSHYWFITLLICSTHWKVGIKCYWLKKLRKLWLLQYNAGLEKCRKENLTVLHEDYQDVFNFEIRIFLRIFHCSTFTVFFQFPFSIENNFLISTKLIGQQSTNFWRFNEKFSIKLLESWPIGKDSSFSCQKLELQIYVYSFSFTNKVGKTFLKQKEKLPYSSNNFSSIIEKGKKSTTIRNRIKFVLKTRFGPKTNSDLILKLGPIYLAN